MNGEKILRFISDRQVNNSAPAISFVVATGEMAEVVLSSWGTMSSSATGVVGQLTSGGNLYAASGTGGQPATSVDSAIVPIVAKLGPGSYSFGVLTGKYAAGAGNVAMVGVVYRTGVA